MKEETALNKVYHTTERFLFEDLQGEKLEVDFDGGEVCLAAVKMDSRA